MKSKELIFFVAFLGAGVSVTNAGVIITMEESGSDVIATLSGSVDTWTGATLDATNQLVSASNRLQPNGSFVFFATTDPNLGSSVSPVSYYEVSTYPTSFGTGTSGVSATTSTASTLLFVWGKSTQNVYIAGGYVPTTPITGVLTWQNQTFQSLGVTEGSYVWSWGNPSVSGQGDTITLNIVPEPSSHFMALAVLACSGYVMRRRKRAAG